MTDQYSSLRDTYAWQVPRFINLAQRCCLHWAADPAYARSTALEIVGLDGHIQHISFMELAQLAGKLANGLEKMGARPGDRVGIIMRDRVESMAIMMACWIRQCIVVAIPSHEHGDVMTQHIRQSRCKIVFFDDSEPDKVLIALQRCPRVQQIVGLSVHADNVMSWNGLIARQVATVEHQELTRAQQPAMLVWPQKQSRAYPPQTAFLIAHQALFGNLPGFVSANNWFPENATGMLTSVSMMSEAGLWGVILPSLFFGIGVRLQHTLPLSQEALIQTSLKISHINTSSGLLCQWLSRTLASPDQMHLESVSVFGEYLNAYWRSQAYHRFGVEPNLCTYISGCGLLWGDSHRKWPSNPETAGRVFPGHNVIQKPVTISASNKTSCHELFVCRTDPVGMVDPAVFIGAWPLKDPADMQDPIELHEQHPCGLIGEIHKDGSVHVAGCEEDVLLIQDRPVHPLQVEQAVMSLPEVIMAAAIHPPSRKNPQESSPEVWVVLELDSASSISTALRDGIGHRILEKLQGLIPRELLRLGLAHRISVDGSGHPRRDLLRLRHGLSGVQPLPIAQ